MTWKVLIVLFFVLMFCGWNPATEAAVIYVRDNYNSIQDAIDNALAEDTIIVREGEYRENIRVSKPLTLKSEKGPDKTIVKAAKSGEPVFYISEMKNAAIIGFTAKESSIAGIYLNKADNIELKNNKTPQNRNGIFLYSSNNNILTNNNSNANDLTGIYLESSHNNTLEKNEANYNKEKGIFLNASNNNNLTHNIANRNEWNGITLWISNNNRVEKNEVMRNTYSIILSGSIGNLVNENYTWTNLYIILPIILIYIGIIMFFIQRKIFSLFYSEL